MKTLHLKFTKSCIHYPGVWSPDPDDMEQMALFKHFSDGMIAIAFGRLNEIAIIAGIHGIKVTAEGSPDVGTDACAE